MDILQPLKSVLVFITDTSIALLSSRQWLNYLEVTNKQMKPYIVTYRDKDTHREYACYANDAYQARISAIELCDIKSSQIIRIVEEAHLFDW